MNKIGTKCILDEITFCKKDVAAIAKSFKNGLGLKKEKLL